MKLRLLAALELTLWTVGFPVMALISVVLYGIKEVDLGMVPAHIRYCVEIIRTGKQ